MGRQVLTASAWRRWPPIMALAACTALTAAGTASTIAPVPVTLLLGLAAYLLASRLPRQVSVPAVVAAAAVLAAALTYGAFATPISVGGKAIEVFLPLLAGWFAGDAAAARRQYLAGVAEQAERERALEAERASRNVREERVRIARELHDVVAHTLAVITVQAGVGRRLMARQPQEAASALESIEAIGRTAQEELRVVLGLLRDDGNAEAELSPAPRLADLNELAETIRASGTPVELTMPEPDRQLGPALELTAYRVVQEALTNVVRHAPGARARVDVAVHGATLRIAVTDDAVTPPGAAQEWVAGHGVAGMCERIAAFGGSLAAGPCPGGGFRVHAEVPIESAR